VAYDVLWRYRGLIARINFLFGNTVVMMVVMVVVSVLFALLVVWHDRVSVEQDARFQ